MKAQVGTLEEGTRIVLAWREEGYLVTGRYVVGRQVQDASGLPVVELKRPHSKSVFVRVPTDRTVDVS